MFIEEFEKLKKQVKKLEKRIKALEEGEIIFEPDWELERKLNEIDNDDGA